MDVHAVAVFAGPFVEGGPERAGAENHPGKPPGVEFPGQDVGVDEGSPHGLERAGGAAPLRQVGSFHEAGPRVHRGRVQGGHVGGGRNPGEARPVVPLGPAPAAHPDHVHVAIQTEGFVEIEGQFAAGHSVADRQGMEAHEGGEGRVQDVPFYEDPAQGVGPVQDHERDPGLGRGPHGQGQGPDEGVVPHPDVLKIEQQDVHVLKDGFRRGQAGAVQAVDRQAREGVSRFPHRDLVLEGSGQPVLRREQGRKPKAGDAGQGLQRGLQAARDRRLVQDGAQSLAAPLTAPGFQKNVKAGFDHAVSVPSAFLWRPSAAAPRRGGCPRTRPH